MSTDCGYVALDAGEVHNDALFAARARCLIVRPSVWVRHQLRRRDRVVCVVAEMHDCLVPAGPKRKRKKKEKKRKKYLASVLLQDRAVCVVAEMHEAAGPKKKSKKKRRPSSASVFVLLC